jgi:hypothetical protein
MSLHACLCWLPVWLTGSDGPAVRRYSALSAAEQRLARPVQATIRDRAWLESGSGAFHDTVTSRPIFRLPLPDD